MRRRYPILAAALAVALLPACDDATEPLTAASDFTADAVAEVPLDAAAERYTMTGTVHAFPDHSTYREEFGSGGVYERPVVGLLMAPDGPQGRQIFIGVLGRDLEVGSYTVRDRDRGDRPREFYATVLDPVSAQATRVHHTITSGTLTIEATTPALRGSFSFESTRHYTFPVDPPVGATATNVEGFLQVDGVIRPRR